MRVRVVDVCGSIAALTVSLLVGCGGGNSLPASCGHGAHIAAGQCVSDVSCGAGTTLVDGGCVATPQCGSGTAMLNGHCVSTESCGPGTEEVNGSCIPLDGGTASACGAGTHLAGGACVPNPVDAGPAIGCGAGTHLVGTACVANGTDAGATVTCGAGTHLVGTACVANGTDAGAAVTCGAGTHLAGIICIPNVVDGGTPTTCGTGTYLSGGKCLPITSDAGITCGPGTTLSGTQCVPTPPGQPTFVVRINVTTIGADGNTVIPVLLLGTNADGSPNTDTVVLDTSRAGAGYVSPNTVTLSPTGSTVYFTPCSSAASKFCVGPAYITLAEASDPNTVLAESQELNLVTPTGVGSDSACLVGGNVIFFNGDASDYIFSGTETITQGTWASDGSKSEVHISVTPSDQSQGLWWDLYFDSSMLTNSTLMDQVYQNAERWPFEDPGHPGFDVSGDGRGCNTVTGQFQIEDVQWSSGGSLTSFTATFEHHCEGGAPALRGCVHYGP